MKKYSTVYEFMSDLDEPRKEQVELLRGIIMDSFPDLEEHIKWNAPSYVFNGEDRITFNTHYPDKVILVFHMGATKKEDKSAPKVYKDETGLVVWNSDIRGMVTFVSSEDVIVKKKDLQKIVADWLGLVL